MEYHYGHGIKTNEMNVNCGTERIHKKFLEISIGGKRSQDDLIIDGRIMLKWILNTHSQGPRTWSEFSGLRQWWPLMNTILTFRVSQKSQNF
jgi:hypothetical protein